MELSSGFGRARWGFCRCSLSRLQGGHSQTEWAAEIGPQILTYYEEYFNTSFPLPKQVWSLTLLTAPCLTRT
jgi:hypothetical protein